MDVFKYNNYRIFLIEWLLLEKKQHRLNASILATKIHVHPTFISQVLKGSKDLSSEQWISICELMNLTEIETDYLHFLLLMNRSGTKEAKTFYKKKVDEILAKRLRLQVRMKDYKELSDQDRAVFYSSWIYSAIQLYCACGEGQTLDELAKKFGVSKNKVEEVTGFLCAIGLCTIEKGRYQIGSQHIHVPAGSPFVIRHHSNWRLRAINSLENTSAEELNLTAPMSISKKDFQIIREKIVKLIQESVEVAKASKAEDLAALTIDFFWAVK